MSAGAQGADVRAPAAPGWRPKIQDQLPAQLPGDSWGLALASYSLRWLPWSPGPRWQRSLLKRGDPGALRLFLGRVEDKRERQVAVAGSCMHAQCVLFLLQGTSGTRGREAGRRASPGACCAFWSGPLLLGPGAADGWEDPQVSVAVSGPAFPRQ